MTGGANVLIADMDEGAAQAAADKLAGGPGNASAMRADVTEDGIGDKVVAHCVEQCGSIDILVNNAGIYPQVSVLEMEPALMDKVYQVNLKGLVFMSKAAALQMAPKGIMVNAIAPGGIGTEGTSKPLESSGMSEEQMKEMMDAFAARIPMKRMGVPDDIAKVAVFLASSASDYMAGEIVVVDEGVLLA